jgi:hypothetical protein
MSTEVIPFKPPERLDVRIYFVRLGLDEKHSDAFFYYYSMNDWKIE